MAQPNILLFMPDQLRPDWVGAGNRIGARTPNVDRLAARGVRFANAVCPSPICGPSRACLATGLEYDRNPVPNNGFSMKADGPNFYRQLARAGYQVLTCGKIDLLKGELDWGCDGQHMVAGRSRLREVGFTGGLDSGGKHAVMLAHRAGVDEPYLCFLRERGLDGLHLAEMGRRRNLALGPDPVSHPGAGPNYRETAPSELPDDAYQDNWIGQCGLDLLRAARKQEAPWFLQVNLAGPHEPMNVTRAMAERVAGLDPELPEDLGELTAQEHKAIRRNYIAMVETVDAILGGYLDFLEQSGQSEDTIVIFTSDHGEMLGDAGLWEKFVPHQASIGVPLVIAGPGIARGRTTDQPATILDLHASALDYAHAEALPGVDSRSLRKVLEDPGQRLREVVFSGLGVWRTAFDGRYKLVAGYDRAQARRAMERGRFDPDSPALLVEPARDVAETNDLSAAHPDVVARLRAAMLANGSRGG